MTGVLSAVSVSLFAALFALAVAVDPDYGQASQLCRGIAKTKTTLDEYFATAANILFPVVVPCTMTLVIEAGKSHKASGGMVIDGDIEFEDVAGAETVLETPFLVVHGALHAGTETAPFSSSLKIVLTDAGADVERASRTTNSLYPAKINFGRKAFAVHGGSIEIYGKNDGPVYAKLAKSIARGDTSVQVVGDFTPYWKVGDRIGVAPSDLDLMGEESGVITAISHSGGLTDVTVASSFGRSHELKVVSVAHPTKGPKTYILRPEVVNLARNIEITGMPLGTDLDAFWESKAVEPKGGHFIIAHSAGKQVVQGVEFSAMGQAGVLGKYPLHFHFGGKVHSQSRFSRNSIHHSKQRCLVVHATDNLLIENNVAYRAYGHCYMTEDAIEQGNKFIGNIGIGVHSAIALIAPTDSDNRATTFWMSAPTNDLVMNVAAGATSGGYWYEGFNEVQRSSKTYKVPGWDTYVSSSAPFGKFEGNVAHTMFDGFMTYPGGIFVPVEQPAELKDMFAWSVYRGWLSLAGWNQRATNAVFLDIYMRGVQTRHVEGHHMKDFTIVGAKDNNVQCGENIGIAFENKIPAIHWKEGIAGLRIEDVFIDGFSSRSSCATKNIGIQINNESPDQWFPPSSLFKNVRFGSVTTKWDIAFTGTPKRQLGFRALNADLPGVQPSEDGYVVSWKDQVGVPVMGFRHGCGFRAGLGLDVLFCPSLCWRHSAIAYKELPAPYAPTSVRFQQLDGHHWTQAPETTLRGADGIVADRVVFQMFSAQFYKVRLIGANGLPVPDSAYSLADFRMYRVDETKGEPACPQPVHFLFQDTQLMPTYPQ